MKVEVAVPNSLCGLCGRKSPLNSKYLLPCLVFVSSLLAVVCAVAWEKATFSEYHDKLKAF